MAIEMLPVPHLNKWLRVAGGAHSHGLAVLSYGPDAYVRKYVHKYGRKLWTLQNNIIAPKPYVVLTF